MCQFSSDQIQVIENLAKFCFDFINNDSDILLNVEQDVFKQAQNLYSSIDDIPSQDTGIIEIVVNLFRLYLHETCAWDDPLLSLEQTSKVEPQAMHSQLLSLELRLKSLKIKNFNIKEYIAIFIAIKSCSEQLLEDTINNIECPPLEILARLGYIRERLAIATNAGIINHNCQYFTVMRDCNDYIYITYLQLCFQKLKNAQRHNLRYIQDLKEKLQTQILNIGTIRPTSTVTCQVFINELLLTKSCSAFADIFYALHSDFSSCEERMLTITSPIILLDTILDHNTKHKLNLGNFNYQLINKYIDDWKESGQILNIEKLLIKINALAFWKKYLAGKQLQHALRMKLNAENEYMNSLLTKDLLKYYDVVTEATIGSTIVIYEEIANKDQCKAMIRTHMQRLYENICSRLDEISPGWETSSKRLTPSFKMYPIA